MLVVPGRLAACFRLAGPSLAAKTAPKAVAHGRVSHTGGLTQPDSTIIELKTAESRTRENDQTGSVVPGGSG